jgi:hypothetical protein
MTIGQALFVQTAGYFTVASLPDATHVVLTNLGYAGNASNGTVIATGQRVSPAGLIGVTGATGAFGPTGAQGVIGATGATGAQGTPGIVGSTGPAGAGFVTGGSGTQPPSNLILTIGDLGSSTTEAGFAAVFFANATLDQLYVYTDSSVNNITFTVFVNGASTTLTCTMGAAA